MAEDKDSADEVVFVHGLTPCPYSVNRADSAWKVSLSFWNAKSEDGFRSQVSEYPLRGL